MLQFCWQLLCMVMLCILALTLWYVFPPLSVVVILIISGIGSSDSDLLSTRRPYKRHR